MNWGQAIRVKERTSYVVLTVMIGICLQPAWPVLASDAPRTWTTTKAFLERTCDRADGDEIASAYENVLGFLGAFAGVVGPTLVDWGFQALADLLEAKKSEFDHRSEARVAGTLYELGGKDASNSYPWDPRYQCLSVVRGEFGVNDAATPHDPEAVWDADRLAGFGLVGPPDFLLQLAMIYPDNRQSLFFEPVFLDYRKALAQDPEDQTRDLVLTVSIFFPAGADASAPAAPLSYVLALPDVPVGARLDSSALGSLHSEVHSLPPPMRNEIEVGGEPQYVYDLRSFHALVTISEGADVPLFYLQAADAVETLKSEQSEKLGEAASQLIRDLLGSKRAD